MSRSRMSPRDSSAHMVRLYRRAEARADAAAAAGKSIPPDAIRSMQAARAALYAIERKYPARMWLDTGPPSDGGATGTWERHA